MKIIHNGDIGVEIRLSRKNLEDLLDGLARTPGDSVNLVRQTERGILVVTAEENVPHYGIQRNTPAA